MNSREVQMMVLLELTAPCEPNDELSDDERKLIFSLWKEHKPWDEVFSVIKDNDKRNRITSLFEKLEFDES